MDVLARLFEIFTTELNLIEKLIYQVGILYGVTILVLSFAIRNFTGHTKTRWVCLIFVSVLILAELVLTWQLDAFSVLKMLLTTVLAYIAAYFIPPRKQVKFGGDV